MASTAFNEKKIDHIKTCTSKLVYVLDEDHHKIQNYGILLILYGSTTMSNTLMSYAIFFFSRGSVIYHHGQLLEFLLEPVFGKIIKFTDFKDSRQIRFSLECIFGTSI